MGAAAYNRGSKLISNQLDAAARSPEFVLIEDLNALPKHERAATPFGPVHFVIGQRRDRVRHVRRDARALRRLTRFQIRNSAMHSFYVNGRRVTQKQAFDHWLASATYRDAKRGTRNEIWGTALYGDASGNHNPHGEVNHLLEAGIELR